MTNFDHLKQLDIQPDKTAEYTFNMIKGQPTLIVKPATESNRPFFNAMLKKSRKQSKTSLAGAVNDVVVKQNRNEDRQLYSQYIVVGWSNVQDSAGNTVEFSSAVCKEWFEALPDNLFDELRVFCGNFMNFIDAEEDIEDIAKN